MAGQTPLTRDNRPAGFVSRLEAFIADLLILLVGGLASIGVIQLILRFFSLERIWNTPRSWQYSSLIFSLFTLGYFLYFWGFLGYTPGKFLLGLKIVRRDGSKLSLGRSILRFIGYWVSAIPLFLGFIWIIFDQNRQGWHDKLADTQVIYTPKKYYRIQKS